MTSRWGNPIANNYLRDKEGNLLPGGTVDFYSAGTTDALAVYSDSDLAVSLGSQITADAEALLPDFHMAAGTEYKAVAKDSGGTTKWTRDDVFSLDSSTDTRLDSLEASVNDLGAQGGNALVNGGMRVATGNAATLSTSFQEGKVKEWDGKVDANVTAGTLTQGESTDYASGHYLHFSGVSTSGSANVVARVQLSSEDAAKFVDAAGTFTCKVYHDIGSSTNFTATIYKADTKDVFTSVTSVQAGDSTAVADQTNTAVTVTSADLGDVSNGIEIQISAAVGTITTKNIRIAEGKFEVGGTATGFSEYPYQIAEAALGSGIPVEVYSVDVTSGTSVDMATVFTDNSSYNYFRIIMENLEHDGAGVDTLLVQVSTDGSTFISTTSYDYFRRVYNPAAASPSYTNSTAAAGVLIDSNFTSAFKNYGTVDVSFPSLSQQHTFYSRVWRGVDNFYQEASGGYDTASAITGVRIDLLANSFEGSGTVRVLASNNPF